MSRDGLRDLPRRVRAWNATVGAVLHSLAGACALLGLASVLILAKELDVSSWRLFGGMAGVWSATGWVAYRTQSRGRGLLIIGLVSGVAHAAVPVLAALAVAGCELGGLFVFYALAVPALGSVFHRLASRQAAGRAR